MSTLICFPLETETIVHDRLAFSKILIFAIHIIQQENAASSNVSTLRVDFQCFSTYVYVLSAQNT